MQVKPEPEDNGQITPEFIKKLIKANFQTYYSTPQFNEVFYLHYKSITKISNLQTYTGLKTLYLEGNAIEKIQGLSTLSNLRCLYLQENLIEKIQGIEKLTQLINLNLSDNMIGSIQGLGTLTKLQQLQLKRNKIGKSGMDDVISLLECQSISALDISNNQIEQIGIVDDVLVKMEKMAVLYLQNNGFNKKVSHYRKSIISKIKTLMALDEKPIFQDERRFAQAWARGGIEEEKKQRALFKQEKEEKEAKQRKDARARIERLKEMAKVKKEGNLSESQESSKMQSLSAYNTPQEKSSDAERSQEAQNVDLEQLD